MIIETGLKQKAKTNLFINIICDQRSDETENVHVSEENIELCTNGIANGPVTQLDGKFDEAQINAAIDICAYDVSVISFIS